MNHAVHIGAAAVYNRSIMDRMVHIGGILQVDNRPYSAYMVFIPEIMDCAVPIGAAFQKLHQTFEHFCCLLKSSNDHIYDFHVPKFQKLENIQKHVKSLTSIGPIRGCWYCEPTRIAG